VYFLGGLSLRFIFFLLSYNIFPALLGINTALIGAFGRLQRCLSLFVPICPIKRSVFIFFNVKLLAYGVFVVLFRFFIQISIGVCRGRLAHLGWCGF